MELQCLNCGHVEEISPGKNCTICGGYMDYTDDDEYDILNHSRDEGDEGDDGDDKYDDGYDDDHDDDGEEWEVF